MFTIRKATIDDRSLIHDLASRIWENTYGKILSKEQLDYMFDMMYAPDNILKQMEELHHQYFIILVDDMPAGYLSIEKTGENTYNFQKIYSLPEMHGTGIGRFIIEHPKNVVMDIETVTEDNLEDYYRPDMPDSFWVLTELDDEALQKLYK